MTSDRSLKTSIRIRKNIFWFWIVSLMTWMRTKKSIFWFWVVSQPETCLCEEKLKEFQEKNEKNEKNKKIEQVSDRRTDAQSRQQKEIKLEDYLR